MPNLSSSLLRLFAQFRRTDLEAFVAEHDRLYAEARRSGDHTEAVVHFYSVMADLLETYYGSAWHFIPPEHPRQSREDAIRGFHRRVARLLDLRPGRDALDLGCGVGSCMRAVALESGCRVSGITMGPNEVEQGNLLSRKARLDGQCRIVQGDYAALPFDDASFDAAYAVYSFKYATSLERTFSEVFRVLRPGGLFLVYDMVKADTFDERNPEHVRLLDQFAYSTGMPPIHSNTDRLRVAADVGFECLADTDLSQDLPWYDHFTRTPLLMPMIESRRVRSLVERAEARGWLPRGFSAFYRTFVADNLASLVNAGKVGAMTGSSLVILRRPADG